MSKKRNKQPKKSKQSKQPKLSLSNDQVEDIKSKLYDLKDPYPPIITFAATLVQFCLYAVLATAGVSTRIMDVNVDPAKFWMLVAVGAVLCTIPVFMYRYKYVALVSFVLCIALGVTSASYSQSSKGVDINAFYYVDLFAIFMTLALGYFLLRKLAGLNVKKPDPKKKKH